MIIKKLKLENVRSYKNANIDFPLGKTLFEGDIGTGKSTLLMAIEFALFGLGDEKPGALLRAGESEAKVGLVFDVNGKEYSVVRGLEKKGKSVQQTSGTLKSEEGVLHLSASEMKEKILEVLHFNEPSNPKAQSVIYRYAVFTPQEEMKEILTLKPEFRLQTLRKAFGLEDYKTASENAKAVLGAIRNRVGQLEAASSDVPALEKETQDLTKEIAQAKIEHETFEKRKNEAKQNVGNLEEEMEKLHAKETKLSKATSEVSLLGESADKMQEEVEEHRRRIIQLKEKIVPLETEVNDLRKIANPTEKSQEELQQALDQHEELERGARKIETQIEAKLTDYMKVKENGICPTCDTKVDPKQFSARVITKRKEMDEASFKSERTKKHVAELKGLLKKKRAFDEAQKDLKSDLGKISEYDERIGEHEKKAKYTGSEVTKVRKKLGAAKEELKTLQEVQRQLEALKIDIKEAKEELETLGSKVSAAAQSVQDKRAEVERRKEQIRRKEAHLERAEVLKEYQIWIEDYFITTLDAIEKQVMLNINQEFQSQFQKWFGMLIEDPGKEARIDEEFTAIVEQDGYEQDVRYLSGGERTSVALAYRLALNTIVQKVSAGMQSNLLILDEPTDGFSREQLSKVREILDELHCPQIVMVSHERELESFADQILKVTKTNGESRIGGS